MPYEEHGQLLEDTSDSSAIWRYLDLAKFVSLLDSRSLYFCRADQFDDPWEGALPRGEALQLQKFKDANGVSAAEHLRAMRRYVYLNCWHLNEVESDAMWKLYGQRGGSVAIRSTVGRLKKSVRGEYSVNVSRVEYMDYELPGTFTAADPGQHNMYFQFIHKRLSFRHESEIRAIVWRISENDPSLPFGLPIPVDFDTLVETVYVSPDAPKWYAEIVRSLCGRYGLDRTPHHSQLYEPPASG